MCFTRGDYHSDQSKEDETAWSLGWEIWREDFGVDGIIVTLELIGSYSQM